MAMTDPDEMLKEHERTWQSFVKLSAITTGVIIVILILMGIFLV